MYFQDMLWSELDNWDLLYGAFFLNVSQLDPETREEKQDSDNCYCTLIKNLTGVWLLNKLWACFGESCWKVITFRRHMCLIDPPVWKEVRQTFWACIQNPGRNQEQTVGIILIYIIFWQSTLSLYLTHTLRLYL